jgi:hypothetical protein
VINSSIYYTITPAYHIYGGLDRNYLTTISSRYCAIVPGNHPVSQLSTIRSGTNSFGANPQDDFHPAIINYGKDKVIKFKLLEK